MTLRGSTYRAIVVCVIFALFGLAALGYYTFRTNLESLQRLNRENLGWSTNQLQLELNRFSRELSDLRAGVNGASPARINQRFDILWSRVALAHQGSLGERIRAYDDESQLLSKLSELLERAEPSVTSLETAPPEVLDALIMEFRLVEDPMRAFSRRVFFGEEQAVGVVRNNLRTSALFTAAATLLAFIIGGAALVIVNRESATNKMMAARNLQLAHAAEAANRTKLQFLTMMSHELRTPMNGVLGLLALTKQRGLPERQLRVIEQAEKSGRQMISMLGDILDYAALQDSKMELDKKPFEPRKLALAIEELFGAVARREGINFEVSCAEDCPHRLEGDFRRLRQIVAHFASFIVEAAGTRGVAVRLGHEQGMLKVEISFQYGTDSDMSERWRPEILLGNRSDNVEQFASDALGPAVARGILNRMGGHVWLNYKDDTTISIILTSPAPVVEIDAVVIKVETQSESLSAICKMALSGEKVVFEEDTPASKVHVVLFEAGGADEMDRLAGIRERHPNALTIALGEPISPSDFDGQIGIPINIQELRQAVLHTIVGERSEMAFQA